MYKTLAGRLFTAISEGGDGGEDRGRHGRKTHEMTGPFCDDGRVVSDHTRHRRPRRNDRRRLPRIRRCVKKKKSVPARVIKTRLFFRELLNRTLSPEPPRAGTSPTASGTLVNYACLALITPRPSSLFFRVIIKNNNHNNIIEKKIK